MEINSYKYSIRHPSVAIKGANITDYVDIIVKLELVELKIKP